MDIWRLIRADWLKTRRTPIRWVVFALPVGYALTLLWYFSTFRVTPELPSKVYEAFFEAWCVSLPLIYGLLTGLMGLQEEQAGGFRVLLGIPSARIRIYGSKLLLLIGVAFGSPLVSATIVVLGMKFGMGVENIHAEVFYVGALLSAAGSMALGACHLWLGFAFGFGASVGVGGAGFLTAAIIGVTSVGDGIWGAVPWAWPVRLAMHPLASVDLPKGLLYACSLFAVVTVLSLLWFQRWEGRKREE